MGVRRFGCLVLLLSFFFSIQIFSQSKRVPLPRVDAENGRLDQQMEFVPGSYLVEFDDQLPSFAQASGAAATVQARVGARRDLRLRVMEQENEARASRGLDRVSERDVIVHDYGKLFNGLSARLQASAAEDLRRVPGIKAVWPQRLMQASVLPDAGVQPQLPGVAEQLAYTGRGTVIAVIDTGIDYRHPDLGGCLGPGCKVIGGYDFANRDSDPLDGEGHGTHVAGIAAANGQMRGVAPDAKLLAVKVLSDQGSGSDGDVIAGIEWAVANGADVINLSLGGPPWPENDPVSRVVEKAVDSGVVVVASAGNSGPAYYTIGSPGIAQRRLRSAPPRMRIRSRNSARAALRLTVFSSNLTSWPPESTSEARY